MKPWTRLYSLRQSAGLSREALSEKSGVSATHIYRLESGKADRDKMAFSSIEALAKALNVTVDELTDDTVTEQDMMTLFVDRLERLSQRDLSYLRRESGRTMRDAMTTQPHRVFFSALPADAIPEDDPDAEVKTEIWYEAACIMANAIFQSRAHEDDGEPAIPLATALGRIDAQQDELPGRLARRMTNAFDCSWTDDGYTAQQIAYLMTVAIRHGYNILYRPLIQDALEWNDTDQHVGKTWTEEYFK